MFHDPQQDVKAAKASVMLMCGKTQDANLHPRGNSKVLMISSAICAWLKAFDKSVWTHCMILYVVQNYYPTFKNETSKTAKCWDISGDLQRLTNTSSSFTLIFATLSVIQSFITPRPWIHELSLAPLLLTSKFEKFQYQGCLFRTSLSQQPPLESLSDSNFQHKKKPRRFTSLPGFHETSHLLGGITPKPPNETKWHQWPWSHQGIQPQRGDHRGRRPAENWRKMDLSGTTRMRSWRNPERFYPRFLQNTKCQ